MWFSCVLAIELCIFVCVFFFFFWGFFFFFLFCFVHHGIVIYVFYFDLSLVRHRTHMWTEYIFIQLNLNSSNIDGSYTMANLNSITKTCLYNFDPLKPNLYSKTGVYRGIHNFFLISAQKHRLWHSLEPPRRGCSNEYPQFMFQAEI